MLLAVCGCSASRPVQSNDVVVLYTNDVHCAVDSSIGYAGLAAYKKQLEALGDQVILADCGDAVQGAAIGALSNGSYIIDIMNQVGYDVAAIGNHEFDYGTDRFFELAQMADFSYLSCNFTNLTTGKLLFEPYKIIEKAGIKIAFIGIATPQTITTSAPVYFQDAYGNYIYGFCQGDDGQNLYKAVQSAADSARAAGADYVIALAHLGTDTGASPYTSPEVIANTSGIDAVLDGHSHSVVECQRVKNKAGRYVLLSQTGTGLTSIGMLCISDGNISTGLISDYSEKDETTAAFISNIENEYKAQLETVVATTDYNLTILNPQDGKTRIVRTSETNLGDLCADAIRSATGADIGFVNGGGVRTSIAAGNITYGNILSVHPFGNTITMVSASGQQILDALELSVHSVPQEYGGFLQVSGLTFTYNPAIASPVVLDDNGLFDHVDESAARRVSNVMVNGQPLDANAVYKVASFDYLIKSAGDGYTMFQDCEIILDGFMLDTQVLSTYLQDTLGGTVSSDYADPYGSQRIQAVK